MSEIKIQVGGEVVCLAGPADRPFPVRAVALEVARATARQRERGLGWRRAATADGDPPRWVQVLGDQVVAELGVDEVAAELDALAAVASAASGSPGAAADPSRAGRWGDLARRVALASGGAPAGPWSVYRCARAGDGRACGILTGDMRPNAQTWVVQDTNRGECAHGMRLADAEHIVEAHNVLVEMSARVSLDKDAAAPSPQKTDDAEIVARCGDDAVAWARAFMPTPPGAWHDDPFARLDKARRRLRLDRDVELRKRLLSKPPTPFTGVVAQKAEPRPPAYSREALLRMTDDALEAHGRMVRGLALAATFLEQVSRDYAFTSHLWDDQCRDALALARALGVASPPASSCTQRADDVVVEACARVANDVFAVGAGDMPAWDDATSSQRETARASVRAAFAGTTARQWHDAWRAGKLAEGWVYGPVRDEARRLHPNLLPYGDLPPEQRLLDDMFVAAARATRSALDWLESQPRVPVGINLAVAIGAIERMARVLVPGCETWSVEELVLAAHRAVIERDEARAWIDRAKPQLEDALAKLAAAEVAGVPVGVFKVEGDLDPEKFAAFKREWEREAASGAWKTPIVDAPQVVYDSPTGLAWRGELAALFAEHCECRPLNTARPGHSHDCDVGITDDVRTVLHRIVEPGPDEDVRGELRAATQAEVDAAGARVASLLAGRGRR